jgi:hypothetical protein
MVIIADDRKEDLSSLFPTEKKIEVLEKIKIPSELIQLEDNKNIEDLLDKNQEVIIS